MSVTAREDQEEQGEGSGSGSGIVLGGVTVGDFCFILFISPSAPPSPQGAGRLPQQVVEAQGRCSWAWPLGQERSPEVLS